MTTEYRKILDRMTAPRTRASLPGEPYGLSHMNRMWIAMKALLTALDEQATEGIVFRRVAGEAICGGCGAEYRTHPDSEEFPFLTQACLGQLVKL